jgi:hypothetical protein
MKDELTDRGRGENRRPDVKALDVLIWGETLKGYCREPK